MAVRPSGEGRLGRVMRRLGSVTRFNTLGTPQPSQQLQQQGTQGSPQPRPPAQGPAAPQGAPSQQPATDQEAALPEGRTLVLPTPGDGSTTDVAATIQPGDLLTNVDESPALTYWRKHGMMPNFFSLQVMATRRQLEIQLGRAPTAREVAQGLSSRDASEDGSGTPAI